MYFNFQKMFLVSVFIGRENYFFTSFLEKIKSNNDARNLFRQEFTQFDAIYVFFYFTIGYIEICSQKKDWENAFECSKPIFPIVTPKREEPIF